MLEHEHGLDQARHAGRTRQVTDVGLDRADPAEAAPIGVELERFDQCRQLDRITEDRPGAMRLDVADRLRRDAGELVGRPDRGGLAAKARRRVARLVAAVVVESRTQDDGPDIVAGGQRVLEPSQNHDADPAADDRSLRVGVERPAVAIGREDRARCVQVAAALRNADGDAARQRDVASPRLQALAREGRRDQRGRAGGLNDYARAAQVEAVGDLGAEVILVVGDHQLHAVEVTELLSVLEQLVQVAAHLAAGEQPDRPGARRGVIAGVFERLPGRFEEQAVLGVGQRRVAG